MDWSGLELAALRAASLCAVWAVQALRNTSFAFHRQCERQRYALLVVLNSGSTTEKARQKWQKGPHRDSNPRPPAHHLGMTKYSGVAVLSSPQLHQAYLTRKLSTFRQVSACLWMLIGRGSGRSLGKWAVRGRGGAGSGRSLISSTQKLFPGLYRVDWYYSRRDPTCFAIFWSGKWAESGEVGGA